MRRQHTTDGYRAGLSAGKEDPATAQKGFDEGYPPGILLGMRVGFLLGALGELERCGVLEKGVRKVAEGEMEVVRLMESMGVVLGRGVVEEMEGEVGEEVAEIGKDGGGEGDGVDVGGVGMSGMKTTRESESWIDKIDSILKWSKVVEDAGRKVGVDLAYKRT